MKLKYEIILDGDNFILYYESMIDLKYDLKYSLNIFLL